MLDYTKAAILKTVSDIKKISFCSHMLFYLAGIVIPIYNIFATKGFLPLHIFSLCLSVFLLIFYLIYREVDNKEKKESIRKKRKKLKRIKRTVNRISYCYFVSCSVYAICFATTDFKPMSMILTVFAIFMLMVIIVFDLFRWVIERRLNLFINAVKEDVSNANPINSAKDFIKRIKGEEPDRHSHLSDKDRIILDDYIDDFSSSK